MSRNAKGGRCKIRFLSHSLHGVRCAHVENRLKFGGFASYKFAYLLSLTCQIVVIILSDMTGDSRKSWKSWKP